MNPFSFSEISTSPIGPILLFLCIFGLLVLLRLVAFHRSLFKEVWKVFYLRKIFITLMLCAEISFFVTLGLYYYTLDLMREEMGQKLVSIAVTAATQFDGSDLQKIRIPRDMKTETYQKIFTKLNDIRNSNTNIRYIYIMRPTQQKDIWEFVVDADSNYNIPFLRDDNQDGLLNEQDEGVAPGVMYDVSNNPFNKKALEGPVASKNVVADQWGTFLSGYAPIKDKNNKAMAIIEVDVELSQFYDLTRSRFVYWFWFMTSFFIFSSMAFLWKRSI